MKPSITQTKEKSSLGQKESCIALVVDATRKATGVACDELISSGLFTKQNVEKVRARGDELVAAITALVKEKFAEIAESIRGFVKLISGTHVLKLDETSGMETIAEAEETFPGWIDSDFKKYGTNVQSSATKKTAVSVYELIKDGTFADIFGGMSDDLATLCLTQPQIIQFAKKHRKWLRTEGYGTFFLFKVGNEGFVAGVSFDADERLGVGVVRCSYDVVWSAVHRRRFVVPQLALEN